MYKKIALSLVTIASLANAYTPGVALPSKLTNLHSLPLDRMNSDFLCRVTFKVNDFEEFKKLPGIKITSGGWHSPLVWEATAILTKSRLLSILDLPFILEAEILP